MHRSSFVFCFLVCFAASIGRQMHPIFELSRQYVTEVALSGGVV